MSGGGTTQTQSSKEYQTMVPPRPRKPGMRSFFALILKSFEVYKLFLHGVLRIKHEIELKNGKRTFENSLRI